ncbi:hypothetical protein CEXT_810291 [Caerostris extrusa]|nr:hypothetical protein CEXT_810291 [Caerostris extrusa]
MHSLSITLNSLACPEYLPSANLALFSGVYNCIFQSQPVSQSERVGFCEGRGGETEYTQLGVDLNDSGGLGCHCWLIKVLLQIVQPIAHFLAS